MQPRSRDETSIGQRSLGPRVLSEPGDDILNKSLVFGWQLCAELFQNGMIVDGVFEDNGA